MTLTWARSYESLEARVGAACTEVTHEQLGYPDRPDPEWTTERIQMNDYILGWSAGTARDTVLREVDR